MLTARPDLELSFMIEMVSAFETTFQKKIGLFADIFDLTSPLAAHEGCALVPPQINVKPHAIWLQLISEIVDTAKYCDHDKVEMFALLLHRCLPMDINNKQNRSVRTVGCRFKLLQCGLSLLQGNILPKALSRNILRERIYSHALEYFCGPQLCPNQSRDDLLEDITILLKFWQTMRSEKKHLITTEVGDYDINPNSHTLSVTKLSLDTLSNAGSDVARSTSTGTGGGWYNTIPHSTSTLSKRSIRSKRSPFQKAAYDKDYMKKRNLILELLVRTQFFSNFFSIFLFFSNLLQFNFGVQAAEIEFLITWYNPNSSPHLTIPGEEAINEWRARPIKLSLWRDYTRLAWFYNPALAIFLPQRIRNAESIEDEVTRLVCSEPIAVSHIPDALKYLVTTKTLLAESHEVCHIFTENVEWNNMNSDFIFSLCTC